MSYDLDLMIGVAKHLAERGHGVYRDDPDELIYQADEAAIVLDGMPQEPDVAIVLSAYTLNDDVSMSSNLTGLQIRTRAAKNDVAGGRELAAAIFLDLHGRTGWDLSTGLRVVQIYRRSHTSGGRDENGRWSVIQNFYADLYVPQMHVTITEESP